MSAPSSVRLLLIHLTANLNLVLGGLAIAFGLYVLIAGADAMATMMNVSEAGADAVNKIAPGGDAKKAGDFMELAGKGIGGVFLAMAAVVAGCMIAQGLPLVLVGLGILFRQGWARIFGILFGIFGLLQGLACLGGSGASRSVTISGGVLLAYGLLSLVALIGAGASAYFARRDLEPAADGTPTPARNGKWALAGVLISAVTIALACGLALTNMPNGVGRGPLTAQQPTEKLQGVWENIGPDAHRIAFAKDNTFFFASDKGSAKGTYKPVGKDQLDLEYDLPDVLFQAQKLAFDIAKKAADDPANPLKGMMNVIEPVRTIKDRVRFVLSDSDKSLTLHGAKKPVAYRRGDPAGVAAFEKQISDQLALANFKLPKVEPIKKDGGKDAKGTPIDDAETTYRKRLAELHEVIAKGQASRIKDVVSRGAGVNDRDEKGETPLMKAVQAGYVDVVKELISLGGDWTVTDRDGNDLFFHAISIGRLEWLVNGLGDGGTGLGIVRVKANTTLSWYYHVCEGKTIKKANGYMVGAANGQLDDLKYMYHVRKQNEGTDVNLKTILAMKDRDGLSALDYAQAKGHKHVVAWLEEVTGAKSTAATAKTPAGKIASWTPATRPDHLAFLKACEAGDLEAVDVALKTPTLGTPYEVLQLRDAAGRTPLMLVAGRGDATLVLVISKIFREQQLYSILTLADAKEQTAFHHAALHGDAETIENLFVPLKLAWGNQNYKVNWFRVLHHKDDTGKTALERAEAKENKAAARCIRQLYEKNFSLGSSVPWDSSNQLTVLEIACYEGDLPLVKQLLQMECPLQRPKHEYSSHLIGTPLMYAASKGHVAVAKTLLDSFGKDDEKKQAYLAIQVKGGATATTRAGEAGQAEVYALLLKHAAK